MSSSNVFNLQEAKTQAAILLKNLRSADQDSVTKALERIKRHAINLAYDEQQLLSHFKLKHSLNIIALENGYDNWLALKAALDSDIANDFVDCYVNGFLNHWFINYELAKAFQRAQGGFLLPYQSQFFICGRDFIEHLGFDASDPHWRNIDYDWVKPVSKKSWNILRKRLIKLKQA